MNRGRRHKNRTTLGGIINKFYKEHPAARKILQESVLLKILCYQKELGNTPSLDVFLSKHYGIGVSD